MRQTSKVKCILLAALSLLVLLSLLCAKRLQAISWGNLPNAVAFRSSEGLALSSKEVSQLNAQGLKCCASSTVRSTCCFGDKVQNVTVNLTVGSWNQVFTNHILYGAWYAPFPIPEENRSVVISDKLARTFFFDADSIGKLIVINGEKFTVCGVFQEGKSLVEQMAGGYPQIYMSQLAWQESKRHKGETELASENTTDASAKKKDSAKAPKSPESDAEKSECLITNLYISNPQDIYSDEMLDKIISIVGHSLKEEQSIRYDNTKRSIMALADSLKVGIAYLLLLGVMTVIFTQATKRRTWNEQRYNRASLIVFSLLLVAFFLCTGGCILSMLPKEMLPTNNILDLGYYINSFVKVWQDNNSFLQIDYIRNLSLLLITCMLANLFFATVITLILAFCILGFCRNAKHSS